MPKMNEPIVKTYKITLKTWLHIWGSQDTLKIWWIDSEVVKNPLTNEPYIPWSSIKWKMRALLEMIEHSSSLSETEKKDKKGNKYIEYWPIEDPNSDIAKTFWCGWKDIKIASRLIFEDFILTKECKKKYEELKSDFFEDKAENNVPRFLSWNATPRHIERVPAWVKFEWNIILIPEEGEYWISKEELEKILERWIELLNKTYLWGGGSRWNWRIEMKEEK